LFGTGKSKTTELKLSLKVRHEESWRREASKEERVNESNYLRNWAKNLKEVAPNVNKPCTP
jgi:hypothetical protein